MPDNEEGPLKGLHITVMENKDQLVHIHVTTDCGKQICCVLSPDKADEFAKDVHECAEFIRLQSQKMRMH